MKKIITIGLVLAMTLLLIAGCAANTAGSAVEGSGSPTMDRILQDGKIKIGLSLNGPPIGFRDDKGTPMGYDVDWATKMAEVLGVELEVVDVDGETRIPALTSGRCDVIFANITGNLERAKTIDFSMPYLKCGIKMIVRDGVPYRTIQDLNTPDAKVCVGRGTTGEELVLKHAPQAQIIYVPNFTDQILQLEQGKADVAFEDNTIVDYAAKNSGGKLIACDELYTSDPICVGMPKGDMEFVRWVDMFVSWQITQGFQEATYEKWWGVKPDTMKTIW